MTSPNCTDECMIHLCQQDLNLPNPSESCMPYSDVCMNNSWHEKSSVKPSWHTAGGNVSVYGWQTWVRPPSENVNEGQRGSWHFTDAFNLSIPQQNDNNKKTTTCGKWNQINHIKYGELHCKNAKCMLNIISRDQTCARLKGNTQNTKPTV